MSGRHTEAELECQAMLLRLLAAATLVTVIASGCGGSKDEAAPETTEPTRTTTEARSERPPAPPITGLSLGGESISLEDFRGRPVLINVWSSW
jgi:cytochrome oxidase Cu insertion factor (SCO1/SenC/PrrC family)